MKRKRKITGLCLVFCLLVTMFPGMTLPAAAALAAPENVTAVLHGVKELEIQWDPVDGADDYVVYRYTSSTKTYTERATTNETSYVDEVPATGYTYRYKVAARVESSNQTGAQSAACSCYATPAPAVPSGRKAVAGGGKKVILSWNASADATGYRIYRYTSKTQTFVELADTTELSYTDITPAVGYTYHYRIAAMREVDGVTLVGAQSAKLSVAPTGGPAVPQHLTAASTGTKEISLQWDADSKATEFIVYRYTKTTTDFEELARTTVPSYTDHLQYAGYTYRYKVSATGPVNGALIETEQAGEVSAYSYAGPAKVSGVTASVNKATVNLQWKAVSDVAYYNILRADTADGEFKQVGTAEENTYIDTVDGNGIYRYAVQAVRVTDGVTLKGVESAAVTAVVFLAPAAPEGFSAASTGVKQVTLTWNASEGAEGYIVYRYTSTTKTFEAIGETETLSYTDNLQYAGYTYRYKVAAFSVDGEDRLVGSQTAASSAYSYAAPGKVTGLAAAADRATVSLQWKAVSDVAYYIILRADTLDGEYTQVGTAENTSYSDTVPEGGTYSYAVQAVRITDGVLLKGAESAAVSVTVTLAPDAPEGFVAASSGIKQVTLTWDASEGADGYIVYRYTSTTKTFEEIGETEALTYTDNLQYSGYTYRYKVSAYRSDNGVKLEGKQTGTASAYSYAAPGKVSGLTAAAADTTVNLQWTTGKNATGYVIFRSDAADGEFTEVGTTQDLTFSDTVSENGTYYYVVQSVQEIGDVVLESAQSEPVSVKVAVAPAVPEGFIGVLTGFKEVTLRWNASEGADGYIVYRYTSKTKTYEVYDETTALTYTDTPPAAGYTYYYKVAAFSAEDDGRLVGQQTDRIGVYAFALPGKVTGVTAAAEESRSIALQWTAVDKATDYTVYLYDAADGSLTELGNTTGSAYTVTGLDAYSEYAFRICANITLEETTLTGTASDAVSKRTLCDHVYGEAVVENRVDPTCQQEGAYDSVRICTVCGEEERDTVVIPKEPHTEGEPVRENETTATCQAAGGYDTVIYCTVCGEELSRETTTIEALPHTPGEPTYENEVIAFCDAPGSKEEVIICTVCGEEISRETVEVTVPHTPSAEPAIENEVGGTCAAPGTCDHVIYCTVCGNELSRSTVETDYDGTNHVGGTVRVNVIAATCISQGNTGSLCCAGCGERFEAGEATPIDLTNHVRNEAGDVTTEVRNARASTCSVAGYTGDTYCVYCNTVISTGEAIATLPHTEVIDAAVAGNCGYPGKTQGSHCSVCGTVLNAQSVIPATGVHNDYTKHVKDTGVSNCLKTGYSSTCYECNVCGKFFSNQACTNEIDPASVIIRGKHVFNKEVVSDETLCTPATCQKGPVYYYTCSKCGVVSTSQSDVFTPVGSSSVGHSFAVDYSRVLQEPTCTVDGIYYETCTVCGKESGSQTTVRGSKLGHDFSIFVETVSEATCTAGVVEKYRCSRCDETENRTGAKNPDAHPENKLQSKMTGVIAPTCTASGEYYVSTVCDACGKILAQNEYHRVDPLPHSTYTVAAKAPTCTVDGNITYYVCNNCSRIFRDAAATQEIAKSDTVRAKLNHRNDGHYVPVYSVQTTCTVDGKYQEVCYCANGCGYVMDIKPEVHTENAFNHMENGVSAEKYVPAAAASCTENAHEEGYICKLCNAVLRGMTVTAPALGHDFSISGNVLNASAQGFFCNRCGVKNPDLLGTYNTLVNSLKLSGTNNFNYSHTVATFGQTTTASNYNRFKSTGVVNILPDVKSQFDSEMRKTETTYSPLYPSGWIRSFLPIRTNSDSVSLLANGDASIRVEKQTTGFNSNTILSSFPDSFKATNGGTYNISKYRNISVSGDVIAVTVTLRQETYTPSGGISGVGAGDMTAMQKFNGKDIRAMAEQYGDNGVMEEHEEDTGYSMVSRMALKSIVSNGTATYYFRASDYQPIAAVYDTSIVTSQDVSMNITLGISSGSITVDPYVTDHTTDVYLFSGFFPAA